MGASGTAVKKLEETRAGDQWRRIRRDTGRAGAGSQSKRPFILAAGFLAARCAWTGGWPDLLVVPNLTKEPEISGISGIFVC